MTYEELQQAYEGLNNYLHNSWKSDQLKKVRNYKELNKFAQKGQILFTGSSLMEQFPINEYAMSKNLGKIVYNRGIGGTTTDDFLREIDTVLFDLEPSKLFINIGTNDINNRWGDEPWQKHLLKNYEEILRQIKARLPETEVYMMAYYPINDELPDMTGWAKKMFAVRTNQALIDTNAKVAELAARYGYHFIDVNDGIKDEQGRLRADITIEGMHMYAGGYASIYDALLQYI